jgi:hypothetical protein
MGYKFVKVPQLWIDCLAKPGTTAATYRTAFYLLDRAIFADHVLLSTTALKKRGVGQRSKWRAIAQLRQMGLIAVEQHSGRLPRVKVRFK